MFSSCRSVLFYVRFLCTAQWPYMVNIYQAIPLRSLGSTWHHTYLKGYYCLGSLCCTVHPCDCLATPDLYFTMPSPSPASPLNGLPIDNHQFLPCTYECVSVVLCVVFHILAIREIMRYLLFSTWLTFPSLTPSRPIHDVADGWISFCFMAT